VAKKSVLDKIRNGIGMEDVEVAAYIKDKADKREKRIEGYKKRDILISEYIKNKNK